MTRRSNDTVVKLASEGYCKRATWACSTSVLRHAPGIKKEMKWREMELDHDDNSELSCAGEYLDKE